MNTRSDVQSKRMAATAFVCALVMIGTAQRPDHVRALDDAASGTTNETDAQSIEVVTRLPSGQKTTDVCVTLWRALQPGEPEPENTVEGQEGIGFYNPVIWEDAVHGTRWVRHRTMNPHDGTNRDDEVRLRFEQLDAGEYRATATTYQRGAETPDPTPYGVAAPFTLEEGADTSEQPHQTELTLGGSTPLVVRIVDAESREPIERMAIRLRDGGGMPIVHGHGSGNYFERTSSDGEVLFGHLHAGEYTVQVLGKYARCNHFVQYEPVGDWVAVSVEEGQSNLLEIPVVPRSLDAAEIERRFPFYVFGRVTDENGEPLADVEVQAATGHGTLAIGGSVQTDADGRYQLYFEPSLRVQRSDTTPLSVGTQAAIISASKPGWEETNDNEQGGLLMSDHEPSIRKEIEENGSYWEADSIEEVVLPGTPREINFTMRPLQ